MSWLKFDASLPEKPETLAITVAMGWDDPDLTVGKLMRAFRWFDQHTLDGNAHNVTPALLDRIIGATGFAQAMCDVGWLAISRAGLSLKNFEKHNGSTAKSRALTAVRVANHRANAPAALSEAGDEGRNADSVTGPLAREEKRRGEDTSAKASVSGAKRASTAKGARLPKPWALPKAWGDWALTEFPGWTADTVRKVAADFADHWHAEVGAKATKADWEATWRKWCRSDITQRAVGPPAAGRVNGYHGPPLSKQAALEAHNAKVREQLTAGDHDA